jgi:alkylation response protein AidB-like acyl-CoA dehydrogenase
MTTAQDSAEGDAELRALREAVRDLVEGCGGLAPARRQLDSGTGYDERRGCCSAGTWPAGLGVPENVGGAGGGLAELTVWRRAPPRATAVPFLSSTVVAGQILTRCPDGPDLLGRMAGGDVRASFAGVAGDGCWRPDRLAVRAENGSGAWRLSGTAEFVLDGATAHQLVAAAMTPDGCDLFLVAGDEPNVKRRALETLDPTRGQAEVSFDGASATALTSGGDGADVVGAALDVVLVVLAAEQVGGAAASLDMAVEYAKIRHQFSRPIGSFQAIKHKLADLLLQVEMGRSSVDRALLAEHDPQQLAEAGAVAKVWCSDAFVQVATENVHVNGGTGFTWEHDAHLFFRRSRADEVLFGDASVHRERLAALLGW